MKRRYEGYSVPEVPPDPSRARLVGCVMGSSDEENAIADDMIPTKKQITVMRRLGIMLRVSMSKREAYLQIKAAKSARRE